MIRKRNRLTLSAFQNPSIQHSVSIWWGARLCTRKKKTYYIVLHITYYILLITYYTVLLISMSSPCFGCCSLHTHSSQSSLCSSNCMLHEKRKAALKCIMYSKLYMQLSLEPPASADATLIGQSISKAETHNGNTLQ